MSFSIGESAADRRRHARHVLHGKVRIGDYQGKLVDVSISGMQAIVDGEPELGRTYPCKASLDGELGPTHIEMTASVRHTVRHNQQGEYRVGLEFAAVRDEMHWRLMDFLSSLGAPTI